MPKPFTIHYPPVLNESIISYLPPYDLKNLTANDQKDFEIEFYLQRPAAKEVALSWKRLKENLISTLERISGAVIPVDNKSQGDEAMYLEILKKNQNIIFEMLEAYFKNDENIEDRGTLFFNLIMHFCIGSHYHPVADQSAEEILNKIFKNKNAEVFLNYLMQSDFKILANEDVWFKLLYNAILNDVPVQLLSRLISMGKNENHFKKPTALSAFDVFTDTSNKAHYKTYYYERSGDTYVSPLLLALKADKSSHIISFLIETFPEDINATLQALNKIKNIKYFSPVKIKSELHFYYKNREEAIASKRRLLVILDTYSKKHEIPLSSQDKEDSLNEIKAQLKDFKHPAECLVMYDLHINACYINNHYRPKLDSFLRVISVGAASSYANTKKDFINSIRKRVYDILTDGDYVGSFGNPAHYLEVCKTAINHPAFADLHDKQGVDTHIKLKLKARIIEIEKTINPILLQSSL